MSALPPYTIWPLGDAAVVIDFGNQISEAVNREVISLFHAFSRHPLPGITEVVPAYSSLAVYYNVPAVREKTRGGQTTFEWMAEQLTTRMQQPPPPQDIAPKIIDIPVCYDKSVAPDIELLAAQKNITTGEVVQLHSSRLYRVYMLGFLPGFTYMGEVDERIALARKPYPVTVAAGSIGIAGRQTGIYPMHSPGGWQIIGRTPLQLFSRDNNPPVLLQVGDSIRFIPISKDELARY